MNKILMSIAIGAAIFIILAGFGAVFDLAILLMFFVLVIITVIILVYLKYVEEPDKVESRSIESVNSLFYKTDEARKSAGRFAFKAAKIIYLIFIIIFSSIYLDVFVSRIIEKINEGLFVYTKLTFMLGLLIVLTMVVIIIINVFRKERIFTSENIRKNAYIYINLLVSLMLIVR